MGTVCMGHYDVLLNGKSFKDCSNICAGFSRVIQSSSLLVSCPGSPVLILNWKITYWPATLVNNNFLKWCNFIFIPPWLTIKSRLWVISITFYHPYTGSFHWFTTFGQCHNHFMVLGAIPGLKKIKKNPLMYFIQEHVLFEGLIWTD